MDLIISLFKSNEQALEILGRAWEILYIEGSSPDVGKRREHFFRLLLEKEFNLKVIPTPPTAKEVDFYIETNKGKIGYSLKTTEGISTIKLSWDSFPGLSKEEILKKAEKYPFTCPIVYVQGDRKRKKIAIYIFEPEDVELAKIECKNFWWIPKTGTNPRGYGISSRGVRFLIDMAKKKENYVEKKYIPPNVEMLKDEYWAKWYSLIKELALRSH
ncbi:hypothetical protein [Archaeoglobus sp.]